MSFTTFEWKDLPPGLAPGPAETFAAWQARVEVYKAANPGLVTPLSAALLNAFEARILAGIDPPRVAVLPGSPYEGQEIRYQTPAMAAAGVVWHLKYRAGEAGPYKWEVLGSPAPLDASSTGSHAAFSTPSIAFFVTFTNGPVVITPLAGDYDVEFGYDVQFAGATLTDARLGVMDVGTAKRGRLAVVVATGTNSLWTLRCVSRLLGQPAGGVGIKLGGATNNTVVNWGLVNGFLRVTPVRVG